MLPTTEFFQGCQRRASRCRPEWSNKANTLIPNGIGKLRACNAFPLSRIFWQSCSFISSRRRVKKDFHPSAVVITTPRCNPPQDAVCAASRGSPSGSYRTPLACPSRFPAIAFVVCEGLPITVHCACVTELARPLSLFKNSINSPFCLGPSNNPPSTHWYLVNTVCTTKSRSLHCPQSFRRSALGRSVSVA